MTAKVIRIDFTKDSNRRALLKLREETVRSLAIIDRELDKLNGDQVA
jgi:hypothetical protein